MTDKEIIVEALEHCIKGDCSGCPNLATEYCSTPKLFYKEILDLINRQQAVIEHLQGEREVFLEDIHHSADQINEQIEEIERLTINMNAFGLGMKQEKERADTIRAEAIKEFWSRLQGIAYQSSDWSHGEHPMVVELDDAEEIYEEMVGEK